MKKSTLYTMPRAGNSVLIYTWQATPPPPPPRDELIWLFHLSQNPGDFPPILGDNGLGGRDGMVLLRGSWVTDGVGCSLAIWSSSMSMWSSVLFPITLGIVMLTSHPISIGSSGFRCCGGSEFIHGPEIPGVAWGRLFTTG